MSDYLFDLLTVAILRPRELILGVKYCTSITICFAYLSLKNDLVLFLFVMHKQASFLIPFPHFLSTGSQLIYD